MTRPSRRVSARFSESSTGTTITEGRSVCSAASRSAGISSPAEVTRRAVEALVVFLVAVSLFIAWRFEWKMAGAGTHVLGIEPANCYVEGRAAERARGTLVTLEPGESRTYELSLEVAVESDG